ncbi:hypothetical protein DXG01_000736 [Tephrocybe rancida]|nr:hypothetical protein DXG01_000736 [Tephrocybe rancida]
MCLVHVLEAASNIYHLSVTASEDTPLSFLLDLPHPLRLHASFSPLSTIFELLRRAQESIEYLHIQATPAILELDSVAFNFPFLRYINMVMMVDFKLSQPPLSLLVAILTSGRSTPRALKDIALTLWVVNGDRVAEYTAWQQIDVALNDPRYASFNKLSVNLTTEEFRKSDPDEFHIAFQAKFRHALSSLYAHNQVTVNLNGRVL